VPLPEKSLIAQIGRMVSAGKRGRRGETSILAGIGDDCAVLRLSKSPGNQLDILVTTDFSLEGIHFRRDWHSPQSVGHRCLTRGLSDIAAMGGNPVAAFLSLAVPRSLPSRWIDLFLSSLLTLADKHGVTLSGGDTSESPNGGGVLADIVIVGSVPHGTALLRSGARPGDQIYVSGTLGGSAAALQQMMKNPKRKQNPRNYPRHFFPEPRIELGRTLREQGLASSMIDTSDGISTDLAHICEASGVGAEVQAELIPRASMGKPRQKVDLQLALHGGEDYELLFTAPRNKLIPPRIAGVTITRIGRVTRSKKMILLDQSVGKSELKPQGWEHFARKEPSKRR
jgi:thiamine-monophosphate kinase